MKIKSLAFLAFFLILSSCSTGTSTSGDDATIDESWHGNFDGTGDVDDDPEIVIPCKAKCPICGKCLDPDCSDEEKCYDLGTRTKYSFYTGDHSVKVTGGNGGNITQVPVSQGGYIENWNNNEGARVEFQIIAKEDTVACFGGKIGMMPEPMSLTSTCDTYINGEQILSNSRLQGNSNWPYIPGTETIPSPNEWYNFTEYYVGCVRLHKGENKIEIVNPKRGAYQFNFQQIILLSDVSLTLGNASGYAEHECHHQNEDGKCTDYTCNDIKCLDKDTSSWVNQNLILDAKEDYVLKYSDTSENLWNPAQGEECIGYIDSGNSHQTIVWSFEASEETFVKVELLMSGGRAHGTAYNDTWDLSFDGSTFTTGAIAGANPDSDKWNYTMYNYSLIGYMHATQGKNTFKMVHKTDTGYNIRGLRVNNAVGTMSTAKATK
ncbi:MAG: hypothetical protein WCR67_06280 [Bacilli bacterium]